METISLILAIVMLVFGVLQIILFFKIWGMTNNVKKISNRFATLDKQALIKEIHKHNPQIADLLFDSLYDALSREYFASANYDYIKDQYRKLYRKAGVEFPSVFESISNDTDWKSHFMRIEDPQSNN